MIYFILIRRHQNISRLKMSDLVRRPGRRLVMHKRSMFDLLSANDVRLDDKMIFIVSILRPVRTTEKFTVRTKLAIIGL